MPRNSENDPERDDQRRQSEARDQRRRSARRRPRRPAAPTQRGHRQRQPASRCQAAPNTTAARPIIEPTDRSMPPVMMTGVSATASRPELDAEPEDLEEVADRDEAARAIAANTAISATQRQRAAPTRRSANQRCTPASCAAPRPRRRAVTRAARSRTASTATAARMMRALDRPLPVRADAEERQRRADRAEQDDAEQRAGDACRVRR